MNNIGALIIGKSPRNELNNELNKLGVSSNDIEIRGALDGLKDSEVQLLKPKKESLLIQKDYLIFLKKNQVLIADFFQLFLIKFLQKPTKTRD